MDCVSVGFLAGTSSWRDARGSLPLGTAGPSVDGSNLCYFLQSHIHVQFSQNKEVKKRCKKENTMLYCHFVLKNTSMYHGSRQTLGDPPAFVSTRESHTYVAIPLHTDAVSERVTKELFTPIASEGEDYKPRDRTPVHLPREITPLGLNRIVGY